METRADAWENVAGLLRRMGYTARLDPAYSARGGSPVLALVTCAPEMLVGYAVAMVAKAGVPGDPLLAWF